MSFCAIFRKILILQQCLTFWGMKRCFLLLLLVNSVIFRIVTENEKLIMNNEKI